MKVYALAPSGPCQIVMAMVYQLGFDDVTFEPINFGVDNKTPEYLKLNPRGQIPTLKDGDFGLGEAAAI